MATEKKLGASGVLYTDRRDFYIDPQVTKELWTDVSPFTTVVSNKETRQTNDPLFKMFEHRNPWVEQKFYNNGETVTIAADGTESAALNIDGIKNLSSSVDDSWVGLQCEIWNAAEDSKKAVVLISTAVDADEIKVKALWTTGGGDYTLVDDDVYRVIGNAHGEGSSAPEAWSDELSVVWNSCQIFKTPLQITGTLLQASLRGESSELARLRLQKSQEHKMQKERAFLFGTRVGGTGLDLQDGATSDSFADGGRTDANGNLIRSTYGVVSAIEDYGSSSGTYQNIFTVDSSYAYSNFVDDMEKVFQYVPEVGVKRAFCGAGAMGYWSKMAGTSGLSGNSGWTVNLSDMKRDTLGFNYKILETPHGILQLIPTPALRGPYNKYMLVVDDSNMFHAQYRSQMYQTNIKTDNAFDGVKDQYFSDEGIGISLIESHNLFKITV
tara:strand:+ start:456 stop:1772 length:1317 start_codon:yes stop_codon:yes gene_type:complete